MDDLGKQLEYTNMEDWYKITKELINNYNGGTLLNYYNSSPELIIKTMYPEYDWNSSRFKKKYSCGQIEWLEFIKVSTPDIRHILNNEDGEFDIPNSRYKADGFSAKELCIYEYNGDYYHGNPNLYNPENVNQVCKKTFGELYRNTIKKKKFCEDAGYNYYSIWESDWINVRNSIIKLQRIYRKRNNTKDNPI